METVRPALRSQLFADIVLHFWDSVHLLVLNLAGTSQLMIFVMACSIYLIFINDRNTFVVLQGTRAQLQ